MKSATIRINIAVSCVLALTVAFASPGHANEVVRVNADGSVTRIQVTGPAPTGNPAPSANITRPQTSGSSTTGVQQSAVVASNGALPAGSSYYVGYPRNPGPRYRGYCPTLPGNTTYTVPPGYTIPAQGYTIPAPGYPIPAPGSMGAPTFAQPGITGVGGTTTYGYYGTPPYPRAYPAYPGHYPAYPGYNCPPPAPVYTYPCAPPAYPRSPYSTCPSTFNYSTTTNLGNFSYRNGGLSVTFGGGQVQSNITSSTRTLGSTAGGSISSSTSITNSSRPFSNGSGRRW